MREITPGWDCEDIINMDKLEAWLIQQITNCVQALEL